MVRGSGRVIMVFVLLSVGSAGLVFGAPEVKADQGADVVMRALSDELTRSMEHLVLDDLPRPYFMQYNAQDRSTVTLHAAYGGIIACDYNRIRFATSRVRVGSPALDNTNVGRGFGGRATLPLTDDYTATRHAIWRMTDPDYKFAVEALTRKRAYLQQKKIEDRPADFSSAPPARHVEPREEFVFDRAKWEKRLRRLSKRFEDHPPIQDADVLLYGGSVTEWIVNSEGTRLRTSDSGVYISIEAELQADDGMPLADSLMYVALTTDALPPEEKILSDIDTMCHKLVDLAKAPLLEQYTGPVLFEAAAAGRVFDALLADGLCARPRPLGSGGDIDINLEKKIGQRILPRSFQVHDDPGPEWFDGKLLAGSYTFDDEGVKPRRVSLVENGKLMTLLASRAPTRKIEGSTGHGRSGGFGDAKASVGCLYVSDLLGMPDEQLKEELLESARDEGLPFALRIAAIEMGGHGELGDPIYAYKVHVDDGREELVRGLRFLPVATRSLRHIIAAGTERAVFNAAAGTTASFITPAVIFEELELTKIEQEFDKLPILKQPSQRSN